MKIRKIQVVSETVFAECGRQCAQPIVRVAGIGILDNPFAGKFVEDLGELYDYGETLGQQLMASMLPRLSGPVTSYGKAAIVGIAGELEQGHAMLHPKLGKSMRAPIGGGEALIPSAARVGVAGTSIDIPLGHKDDAWSFDHFDAMTVMVPDAPRPDEILMAIAIADGGRPFARVGKSRAAT